MTDNCSFTQEDYMNCAWEHVPLEGQSFCYYSLVLSLERALETASGETEEQMLTLLLQLADFGFNPSNGASPFNPSWISRGKDRRSLLPKDLTPSELQSLANILEGIADPLLKGRVADTLWLAGKPRNPLYAQVAINAYSDATDLEKYEPQTLRHNFARALVLAHQMRQTDRAKSITVSLASLIKENKEVAPYHAYELAAMLHEHEFDARNLSKEESLDHLSDVEAIARGLYAGSDYDLAGRVFELVSQKARKLNEHETISRAKMLKGDCYYQLAKDCEDTRPFEAHYNSVKALAAYREVQHAYRDRYDTGERIKEVLQALPNYGQKTNDMMLHEFSTGPFDLSEIAHETKQLVSRKNSPASAVNQLAYICPVNTFTEAVKTELESKRGFLSDMFATSSHFGTDGSLLAKGNAPNAMAMQMFSAQSQFSMKGCVLPGIEAINLEHEVDLELFESLCRDSPMVPEESYRAIAHGLFLGWELHLTVSIYILAPHLEQMARKSLKAAGAITTTVEDNGVTREVGLGSLLKLDECERVFGHELTEELKAIFTEVTGYNARNDVAHGLLTESQAQTVKGLHAWWIILRVIVDALHLNIPKDDSIKFTK